jgi:hypothetical protein
MSLSFVVIAAFVSVSSRLNMAGFRICDAISFKNHKTDARFALWLFCKHL